MKVKELIKELQQLDQESEVYYDQSSDLPDMTVTEVKQEWKRVVLS